jgi:hypothetical protein
VAARSPPVRKVLTSFVKLCPLPLFDRLEGASSSLPESPEYDTRPARIQLEIIWRWEGEPCIAQVESFERVRSGFETPASANSSSTMKLVR